MRNPLQLVMFLSVVTLATILAHRYLYVRTVRDLSPSARWQRLGRAFWAGAAFFLVAGMIGFRFLPPSIGVVLAGAAFGWMGLLAIFLPMTLLGEPVRLWQGVRDRLRRATADAPPLDPGRRVAIARFSAAVTTVGGTSIAAAGVRTALSDPELREVTIALERLPKAFDGLRIVHLTDIHVGPTIGREFTEHLEARVNALKPDLVVLTGDLVDGGVRHLAPDVAPLGRFVSRYGTFMCTGNHEYYSGVDPWCEHFESLGVRVLRNARVTLERDGAALDLIGVDDWGGRSAKGGFDLAKAIADRDAERCAVLLCHQPKGVDAAAEAGLDLVLSGHTHGGQIWPYNFLVKLQQPYVQGLHAHTARTQIYVHPGTGYWGPPIRLKVPAEIGLITLVCAPTSASA
ncbi:metallophosphoesterase [Myxococcota bacterium]|nr:metallophosphoesterase [Myxococcota bacterium]